MPELQPTRCSLRHPRTHPRFSRRLGGACIALAGIGLGYLLVDPTARSLLWGVLCRESFYRGKPANYWAGRIIERDDWLPVARPFPWNWLDRIGQRAGGERRAELVRLVQPLLKGDPAAVPVLIELLRHANEGVRTTAAKGLRAIGPAARDATPALALGLSDTEEVQEKSFQALSAIGPGAEAAVPALKAIIRAEPGRGPAFAGYVASDSYTAKWPRIAAATVLARIAPGDEEILPALLQALHDREEPDKRLLCAALETLGGLGPRARAAVPGLLEILKAEPDDYSVMRAGETLKRIDPGAAAERGVK
jgi:hypothetical protein